MAKNITIAEGSQAKNFNNVHKLRTNLIGGGTQYWVPEDEAGAYAKLSEKTITSNGTYTASEENKDGYSKVTVNVQPDLTTKQITENGTYYARSDGADGYSTVTVNVRASGEGEFVTGVDPTDGNEYEITVDENTKELKKELMPSYIALDYPPGKLRYNDGESLLKIGMVAKAYSADHQLWRDSVWSSDSIPNSEITLVPNKADATKAVESGIYYDLDISPAQYPIYSLEAERGGIYVFLWYVDKKGKHYPFQRIYMAQAGFRLTGSAKVIQAPDGYRIQLYVTAAGNRPGNAVRVVASDTVGELRFYYGEAHHFASYYSDDVYSYSEALTIGIGDLNYEYWAPYTDLDYGNHLNEFITALALGRRELLYQDISAQWKRPDNKILKTSYQIEIPTFEGE